MAATVANSPRGFHVQYVDDIAILVLNNTENRFNQNSTEQLIQALDIVERYELFLQLDFSKNNLKFEISCNSCLTFKTRKRIDHISNELL